MNGNDKQPKSLREAIIYFSDPDNCLAYMVPKRWPDGIVCPTCGRRDVTFLAKQRKWQCKSRHHHRQFSVKVGTIFEDSPLGLDKWLPAVWMLTNCKNGISSYELGRALKVTQKTAWFMLHRIRLAMQDSFAGKLGGPDAQIECDETWVGGKAINMHKSRKLRLEQIRSQTISRNAGNPRPWQGIVFGVLDREQRRIRAHVVPNIKRQTLQEKILEHVERGSNIYTDDSVAYAGLADKYAHEVVSHMSEYVRGQVHTNGLENFWSLLKRGLRGTYVAVEPFHLFRYVDEQVFRFNNRATKDNQLNDADRFALVASQLAGKRLTFAEVTGKVGETPF